MNVVIEGPDNSGKSTLADILTKELRMNLAPGEGPAISESEINTRMIRFLKLDRVIFDRHPAVSQPIYNNFRRGPTINSRLEDQFYNQSNLIIYCRGRDTLEGHIEKDKDERVDLDGIPHKDIVKRFHSDICRLYDQWGAKHADLIYRIGDDVDRLIQMVRAVVLPFDPVADMKAFHEKFGLGYHGPVRVLPREFADFRIGFMREELAEYEEHDGYAWAEKTYVERDIANYTHHLEHQLDAFVDLVYVVFGTAYLQGMLDHFPEAWRRVHSANMKKIRAPNANASRRGSSYDVIKPKDWEAPRHIDMVEQNDLSLSR